MTKKEREVLREHIAKVAAWALKNGCADVAAFLHSATLAAEAKEKEDDAMITSLLKKPRQQKKIRLYGGRGRPIAIDFFKTDLERMMKDEKKKR